jgi:hypothetical protein
MKKYLVISCVGDNSLHESWLGKDSKFDIFLIYYGDNDLIFNKYSKQISNIHREKGQKYYLLKSFINKNINLISNYKYIWLPDDDLMINVESINNLFDISNQYMLSLSQPSMIGYVSHEITKPIVDNILRYTNFVEVISPLMNIDTLFLLKDTFDINKSAWGLDYLWSKLLNYPKDKIAIIDKVIMTHTKPIGINYNRFKINPQIEMSELLNKYKISPSQITYKEIKIY